MLDKHSYSHSRDAVVCHSGGYSGSGCYIASYSQFGVVLNRLTGVLADSRNRLRKLLFWSSVEILLNFPHLVAALILALHPVPVMRGNAFIILRSSQWARYARLCTVVSTCLWSWPITRLKRDSSVGLVISFCCLRPRSESWNLGLLLAMMT